MNFHGILRPSYNVLRRTVTEISTWLSFNMLCNVFAQKSFEEHSGRFAVFILWLTLAVRPLKGNV